MVHHNKVQLINYANHVPKVRVQYLPIFASLILLNDRISIEKLYFCLKIKKKVDFKWAISVIRLIAYILKDTVIFFLLKVLKVFSQKHKREACLVHMKLNKVIEFIVPVEGNFIL